MNYLKYLIIALFFISVTSHSFALFNTIKNYHLDTLTAFAVPAALMYRYANTADEERQRAQTLLDDYYNNRRAFTVDEINRAHDIANMTPEQLIKWVELQTVLKSFFAGLMVSCWYGIIRYRIPLIVSTPMPFVYTTYAAP